MKIKLVVDKFNSHAHFRVFVNGSLAGKLCFRAEEFMTFIQKPFLQTAIVDWQGNCPSVKSIPTEAEVAQFELVKENICCDCEGLATMGDSDCYADCTAFRIAERMIELGRDKDWDWQIPAENREAERMLESLNKEGQR